MDKYYGYAFDTDGVKVGKEYWRGYLEGYLTGKKHPPREWEDKGV